MRMGEGGGGDGAMELLPGWYTMVDSESGRSPIGGWPSGMEGRRV